MIDKKITILHESLGGHRKSYLDLFKLIMRRSGLNCDVRGIKARDIYSPGVLFSTMFEEHPLRFFVLSVIRSFFGLRSVSLLFRTADVIAGTSMRMGMKRLSLLIMKRFSCISIISIVPFEKKDEISSYIDDWIYDPQLWDIELVNYEFSKDLSENIRLLSKGRIIVTSLGGQSIDKGLHLFDEILGDSYIQERYFFVVAGQVSDDGVLAAKGIEDKGGLVLNRYITDDEILSLYITSDFIWSCYSPDYDQASGIFGRAVQMGRIPMVRETSIVSRMAVEMDIPHLAIPWDASSAKLCFYKIPINVSGTKTFDSHQAMSRSLNVIGRAIGSDLIVS